MASGQVERWIADVKTVSLGAPPTTSLEKGGRAVDIRDSEVPGHFRRTAVKMDQSLGHLDGNGPLSRRLAEYGQDLPLCFGGYGEGSE